MSSDKILYLAPYLISLAISFGILIYSWLHRREKGAAAYTMYMAGQFLSLFGFLFEMVSPHLEIKILWDKFQWIAIGTTAIPAFLLFAIQFTDHKIRRPALFWFVILVIPTIFNILVTTDGAHHLIYSNPYLSLGKPFSELKYDFTTTVYIFAIYIYVTPFYGLVLLAKRSIAKQGIYRWQMATIFVGFLIPLLFSIFSLLNIYIAPQRDSTPFTFAIGNLIVAWGLFRYGTFEIVPIARERVVENMSDPVFVLDMSNRIVDINSSALMHIRRTLPEVIGLQSSRVLSRWPDLINLLEDPQEQKRELSIKVDDDSIFFDINISYIYNNRHEPIGRTVVARDITRIKALEVSYRIISTELDQRVRERTQELRRSEEQYRALFEDSPIPLLEEDFSQVKERINELTRKGVNDFEAYFAEHQEVIIEFLKLVRVVNVNKAAINWYEVENKEAIQVNLGQLMSPGYASDFALELLPLIQNKNHFEINVARIDHNEQPLHLIINGNISPGHESTWDRIMISIMDITKLKRAETNLAIAYDTTLEGWAKALELKDKETEGHSRRVINATVILAKAMGYKDQQIVDIRRGTILHDIGKMAIPDEILKKQGPLTDEERKIIQRHPQVAYDLLKNIPHLESALEIPYSHHEKWDGTGYPRGLKGEGIPLTARIFAVVDVWDALSFDRPYRGAWERTKVIEYLQNESGKHFDPKIVNLFIEILKRGEI